MLDYLKLGRWLNHGEMGSKAKKAAMSIATRWDVEQGERKPGSTNATPGVVIEGEWYEIPPDLRDTRPRLYRTAPDPVTGQQGRVSGRILPDDLVGGSPSSAVPILFAFVPLIALVLFMGASIGTSLIVVPALLALGICLAFISNATGAVGKGWVFLSLLAAFLPMKAFIHGVQSTVNDASGPGVSTILGGAGFHGALSTVNDATGPGVSTFLGEAGFWSGSVVIVVAALLFGGLRGARVTLGVLIGVAMVVMASGFAPELFKPMVLLLPACALPWGWSFFLRRSRGIELAIYGTQCNWEDSANGLGHVEARRAQTLRAAKEYASCK